MSTDNTQEDYDENTSAGIFGNGLDRPDGEQPTTPAAHTPLPWHIGMKPGPMIYGPQGEQIADLTGALSFNAGPNAAFIVRACNSHERLVDALEEIVRQTNLLPAHLTPEAVADFNAAVVVTVRNVALASLSAAKE